MKNDTPIYVEAIIEAKRRTKRGSAERKILEDMDIATRPKKPPFGSDPITIHYDEPHPFYRPVPFNGPGPERLAFGPF